MAVYDHDIQAAVDATSIARDTGRVVDDVAYLRAQLTDREVVTRDDDWLRTTAAAIERDPDVMITEAPADFDRARHRMHLWTARGLRDLPRDEVGES